MFDPDFMLYDCSVGSPQLLIDELPDSSYVARLVEPITNSKIQNYDFSLDYVEEELLPEIKNIIRQGKKSMFTTIPKLMRLVFDNYVDDSFSLMKTEILPVIKNAIQTGGPRKAQDVTELFIEICSLVPREFRDDFVSELIHKFSIDPDYKIRNLAVQLIPVVRDSYRVLNEFMSLSKDKNQTVRATIVSNLTNYTFEENVLNSVLCNAIRDPSIGVQQVAASVFGSIAPQLTKEYCMLLRNPETVRNAFPSMPQVVSHSSFAEIFDSFLVALSYDKNDAALALLETAQKVHMKSEESLYIRAAQALVSFSPFTWRLHSFSQLFTNKTDFIELLDPSKISDWRTRFALLKQCQEFVPDLGSQLIRLAEIFSEDQIAYIRNESVNLWVMILKECSNAQFDAIQRLMRGSWQKRMVLAKVIGVCGTNGFEETIKALQNDPVENVRHCINSNIPQN